MKPSKFLIAVLNALDQAAKDNTFTSPHWIAVKVFPRNHPGWQRRTKAGPSGTRKGGGMDLFMGGYLGKLNRAKLVATKFTRHDRVLLLTDAGRDMLESNRHLLEKPE